MHSSFCLKFLYSQPNVSKLEESMFPEVVMMGRSNSGKSTALNNIVRQKNLARTSKTPGRTQLINVFQSKSGHNLIDLPGYGYAKVPYKQKLQIEKILNDYLSYRQCFEGVFLVMDIRHPLKSQDKEIIDFCLSREKKIHILLNKSDKISKSMQIKTLNEVKIKLNSPLISIQTFSSLKQQGIHEAQNKILSWWGEVEF